MYKITLIAGATPNFMKIAPIIHALDKARQLVGLRYRLVHTDNITIKICLKVFLSNCLSLSLILI